VGVTVKRLRCEKCGMTASGSWAFMWHRKEFATTTAGGKQQTRQWWLCPDCAAQFRSDRARDDFLKQAFDETER